MSSSARYRQPDLQPIHDDIIHFSEVSWDDYERLLVMRGDHSAPRIAYLEGEVEIMSPSQTHENIKSLIGRLVETYFLERDIEFSAYGSWTFMDKARNRGAEPDECCVFGTEATERPHPAIEVVWTHGRIDKLEIYRQLGVAEVWFWRQSLIQPYCLRGERYEPVSESQVLPGLDLALPMRFIDEPTTSQAIRGYRNALRGDERG